MVLIITLVCSSEIDVCGFGVVRVRVKTEGLGVEGMSAVLEAGEAEAN